MILPDFPSMAQEYFDVIHLNRIERNGQRREDVENEGLLEEEYDYEYDEEYDEYFEEEEYYDEYE